MDPPAGQCEPETKRDPERIRDQSDLVRDEPGVICSRKGRSVWNSLHP
jgi:hypothetical protein